MDSIASRRIRMGYRNPFVFSVEDYIPGSVMLWWQDI